MPEQGFRPKHATEPNEALEAYARRLARAEALTRIVCVLLGLVFAVGAVVLFVLVSRLGQDAIVGAVAGALALLAPAWFLVRRGLSGQDLDRYDLQAMGDSNIRLRWW
jgi:hypothetical protein